MMRDRVDFALQVGLLLVVLAILVGAIVRGFLRDVERQRQRQERDRQVDRERYRYHEIL